MLQIIIVTSVMLVNKNFQSYVTIIWIFTNVQHFQVFGFEHFASLNLNFSLDSDKNHSNDKNVILKIANGFLIYFIVYLSQRIFNSILHERYFKNSIQQFVDVCSIANISVFILFTDCYGFYIHGRYVHSIIYNI